MKKYIILIGLCILAFIRAGAVDHPQDSIKGFEFGYNFNMDDFDWEKFGEKMEKFNEQMQKFSEEFKDFDKHFKDFEIDTTGFSKLRNFTFDSKKIEELRKMGKNFKMDTTIFIDGKKFRFNRKSSYPNQDNPTRTENKTFTNITEIFLNHQHGNVTVKESDSKQVDLEIRYIDYNGNKAVANTSVKNGSLSIHTSNTGKTDGRINYIITIPKNTAMHVNLIYGNIRMDNFQGAFSSNLMYSNLKANSFINSKPVVTGKYGNVKITDVPNIVVDASYTNVKIENVNKMELSGDYNNYTITNVKDIVADKYMSGNFKIGSINNIKGNMKYTNITINNLTSSFSTNCDYSNIKINNVSSKLNNVDIKGRYSDVTLSLPNAVSASFNVDIKRGTFSADKKYTIKYTEQAFGTGYATHKGQIGSKKPTAVINISNSYANIKFK